MNPDIIAVPRGRQWALRPRSLAGGMFLAEGGEQRRDGSLMVTPADYDFLVRRAAELGLEICAMRADELVVSGVEEPLERMYNLPSKGESR